jgi:hypothetical protein
MFILKSSEDSKDGAFCVFDDYGEKVLYFFETYDDAYRYAGLLEAEDYPRLEVVEVDDETALKACEFYNYQYVIIMPTDVVIPPRENVIHKNPEI